MGNRYVTEMEKNISWIEITQEFIFNFNFTNADF